MASLAEKLAAMFATPAKAPPEKSLVERLVDGDPLAFAAPTATIDVAQIARSRLDQAGRFVDAPELPERPPGPTKGVFRGIEKVGRRRPPPAPKEPVKPLPDGVQKLSLALLQANPEWTIHPNSKIADAQRRAGVTDTPELKRIIALPRRPAGQWPDLTDAFRKPDGQMRLWPIQSGALSEARSANGALCPIGVGHGKTLTSLLIGSAMDARRVVLLVPPQLRTQLIEQDIPYLNKHWKLPLDKIRVVAYSELSNAKSHDILDQIKPDLIVADECHNLRHRSAARTKRFLRYMKDNPGCRFVGLSGTITRRSLMDFAHLAELALKKNSPLPGNWGELNEWAEAIDVSDDPMPPGALLKLCSPDEVRQAQDPEAPINSDKQRAAHEAVRSGFRRRLVETPGVIATDEGALGTSLVITGLHPLVPANVQLALRELRSKWEIDGDELVDALSVARVARQLAGGFFYRWVWPNGEKDVQWLEARSSWNREVREILKLSRKGLDSPMLVTKAVLEGRLESTAWAAWAAVKDRPEPPREAVWLHKFIVDEAILWAKETCSKAQPGIIWYMWDALGQAIAKEGNLPFFGPGTKASAELTRVSVKKTPVIVASIAAHGTGKNLQAFCRSLFTTPPSGGVEWEQTIARTHRPGQLADEVAVDVFLHTDEMEQAFANALRDAEYIEQSQGQRQKLLYARKLATGSKS